MRWSTKAAVAAVTVVGAGAAALAAGRYVSEVALRPRRSEPLGSEPLIVHGTAAGRVVLTRTTSSARPGRYALTGPDCHAVVGEVLSTAPDSVTRRLERVDRGELPPGARVLLSPQVCTGNPRSAHDLSFVDAEIPGELGTFPGWFVPGVRGTWVITVHGLGATREQPLAVLPLLHELELPVLDITYRNDPGAPRSPDRIGHLGDTEWRDLDAAMRWAVQYGARELVLYGWSVGATMALHAADRSPLRSRVSGLVLDSPILDWQATLRRLALGRGIPAPLVPLGIRAAEGRTGLRGGRLAQSAHPDTLTAPVLLFHGPDDSAAPWDTSRELAERRADLVVLHTVEEADHQAMWNADPPGYETALRRFLTPLL